MSIDIIKFIETWPEPNADPQIKACITGLVEALRKEMDADYLGDLYRTEYVVSGRGAFPIDMLRYAESWPASEADAAEVDRSIELADSDDMFTIRLAKTHRDSKPNLADRWLAKFKWTINPRTVETRAL